MLDAQNAPAAPATIRREDYRPPDWLIPEIALDFQLDAERTIVRATLKVTRNGAHDRPLLLDTDELELLGVKVDGAAVDARAARRRDRHRARRRLARRSRPRSRSARAPTPS